MSSLADRKIRTTQRGSGRSDTAPRQTGPPDSCNRVQAGDSPPTVMNDRQSDQRQQQGVSFQAPLPRQGRATCTPNRPHAASERSEEHTSELQSLMRISYAVFCLKKKTTIHKH